MQSAEVKQLHVANEAGWSEPQPLAAEHDRAAYPIDALPSEIRAAVEEVVQFVQCPEALATCSALSALSLAGQALVDVERAGSLEGPSSLYLLAVAESGERKTTADKYFTQAIRAWELRKRDEEEPQLAEKRANLAAWEAKKEATLLAIKSARKSNKSTGPHEHDLRELEKNKPTLGRWPQLLYAETTPEALAWDLAKPSGWQSGGMIASEAGIVFGSHGMGRDSIMRNLSLLNSLWDGASHNVNRRTSESFSVRGVRLTMGLAAQPDVVRDFLESAKLARGIGFVARFLIAWPDSNQGNRRFKEAASWTSLETFNRRIDQLLSVQFRTDERGALDPVMLRFSPEAKNQWVSFYEDIESELRPGKSLSEMADIASKAADNAARIAALFHLYQHGTEGEIGKADMTAANKIVGWHLYEARRFLGDIALPQATSDAKRLSEWMGRYCREKKTGSMTQRTAQNFGPVRHGERFLRALAELEDAGHSSREAEGRKRMIKVNPALWEQRHGAE